MRTHDCLPSFHMRCTAIVFAQEFYSACGFIRRKVKGHSVVRYSNIVGYYGHSTYFNCWHHIISSFTRLGASVRADVSFLLLLILMLCLMSVCTLWDSPYHHQSYTVGGSSKRCVHCGIHHIIISQRASVRRFVLVVAYFDALPHVGVYIVGFTTSSSVRERQ